MRRVGALLVGGLLGLGLCALPFAPKSHAAPTEPRLYVLGDSWSSGDHADPTRTLDQIAAAQLHWQVRVDAQNGTGYLNSGGAGRAAYTGRAARVPAGTTADVVLVQGGSNDVHQPLSALPGAVRTTIGELRSDFPGALVVLLGPGPDPYPTSRTEWAIDAVLSRQAAADGVPYISMLREGWITGRNLDAVISPANAHPTVAGDRYLGRRLAEDLARIDPDPGSRGTEHPR